MSQKAVKEGLANLFFISVFLYLVFGSDIMYIGLDKSVYLEKH